MTPLVDQEQNLDAFLISAIGLADVGNDVIGGNQPALSKTLEPCAHYRSAQRVLSPALKRAAGHGHRQESLPTTMDPEASLFSWRSRWASRTPLLASR